MHVPVTRPRDWYEILTAEKLVFDKKGRRWTNPMRERNEASDCRMLAVAALHSRLLAGLDLNAWCERFEEMLSPPVNGPPSESPRVYQSKWMQF